MKVRLDGVSRSEQSVECRVYGRLMPVMYPSMKNLQRALTTTSSSTYVTFELKFTFRLKFRHWHCPLLEFQAPSSSYTIFHFLVTENGVTHDIAFIFQKFYQTG